MSYIPLYLLFLTFASASIWYYKCGKGKLFLLILFIYTISAFFSILYVFSDFFTLAKKQEYPLTYLPLIYWCATFGVCCMPLIKYDRQKITKISCPKAIINTICLIGLIASIPPFIELLPKAHSIFSSSDLASTLSDIHDDNEKTLSLSFVSKWCYRILRYLYIPIMACIIPVFISPQKNKLSLAGIILTLVVLNMAALIMSSRGILLTTLLNLSLLFILFRPILSLQQRKTIMRYFVLFFSAIVSVFAIITIYRNIVHKEGTTNYTMMAFLSRYAGEGFINFDQYMNHIKNNTEGDYCFWILKKIIGYDMHDVSREYLYTTVQSSVGIPMMIFYTFIGFFVIDFGYIGAFTFFIIVSLSITRTIHYKNGEMPFSSLFLLFIYASIIIDGVCLYRYSWNSSAQLLFLILFYFFLRLKRA